MSWNVVECPRVDDQTDIRVVYGEIKHVLKFNVRTRVKQVISFVYGKYVIRARVVSVRLVFLRPQASARTAATPTSSVASTTASTSSISMILRRFTVRVSFAFDFEMSGKSAFFAYMIFRNSAVFAHMTRGVAPPAFTLKLRTLGFTT